MKELETARLKMRHFAAEDLQAILQAVQGDPDVCRFYCGDTRFPEESCDARAARFQERLGMHRVRD